MLALLPRRDGFPRAADGQHAIAAAFIVQAFGQELGEIVVADGLAGRQLPSPNTRKGLPRLTRSTCPDSDLKKAVGRTIE